MKRAWQSNLLLAALIVLIMSGCSAARNQSSLSWQHKSETFESIVSSAVNDRSTWFDPVGAF